MSKNITFRQGLNDGIRQEMRRDETIILIGEDIAGAPGRPEYIDCWGGTMQVTKGLITEFGVSRVIDTPISESAIVGAALGAAISGLRPVAEIMFIGLSGVCHDQIVNQAAKIHYMFGGVASVPLTIRTNIGAGVGAAAQHSDSVYSVFAHYPGLKVVVPSNPADAKGLMAAAIRDDNPVIFCEHKCLLNETGDVPDEEYVVPLGRADVKRSGQDVTIVAIGAMVNVALAAAESLAEEGIDSEVLDPRTIAPLDEAAILASVEKTRRLVVVDEDHPCCGIARDIAARVVEKKFHHLRGPVSTVTPPETSVPFAPEMEGFYIPDADNVIDAVHRACAPPPAR